MITLPDAGLTDNAYVQRLQELSQELHDNFAATETPDYMAVAEWLIAHPDTAYSEEEAGMLRRRARYYDELPTHNAFNAMRLDCGGWTRFVAIVAASGVDPAAAADFMDGGSEGWPDGDDEQSAWLRSAPIDEIAASTRLPRRTANLR